MVRIIKNTKSFLSCFIALLFLTIPPVAYCEIIEGEVVKDEGEKAEDGLKPDEAWRIAEPQGQREPSEQGGFVELQISPERILRFYTIATPGISGNYYTIDYAACSEAVQPNVIYYLDLVSAGRHKQKLKLGDGATPELASGSSISLNHIWSSTRTYRSDRSKWSDVSCSRVLRISSSHLYHIERQPGPLEPIIFTHASCVYGAHGNNVVE
ncbi:MAG: hypothetical protein ABIK61_04345 [candidate division WOR-3 bacterium]